MIAQLAAMLFLTTPYLEGSRAFIATSLGLDASGIWIPVSLILLIMTCTVLVRLIWLLANPISELAKRSERGQIGGYAFKKKSKSREEDALKHFIDSQSLKANEMEQQVEELEEEINRLNEEFDAFSGKDEEQEQTIMELRKQLRSANNELETLKEDNTSLESALAMERNSKVGMEVEKRTGEIYAQMEKAMNQRASNTSWMPSVLQELKTPITIIKKTSKRLLDSWGEVSFSRLKDDIQEIDTQSDLQISILESESSASGPENGETTHLLPEHKPEEDSDDTLEEAISERAETPLELDVVEEEEEEISDDPIHTEKLGIGYRSETILVEAEEEEESDASGSRLSTSNAPTEIIIPSDNPDCQNCRDLIEGRN